MMRKTVLVFGGAGQQNLAIIRAVSGAGYECRAVTRSAKNAGRIEAAGGRPVCGDLSDVQSLEHAARGCEAAVLTLPLVFDIDLATTWVHHVIQAARNAKIKRLVFNASGPAPHHETGVAAVDIKVRAARLLAESAIPVVRIEPALYMENLASPWAASAIVLKDTLAYPLPAAHKVSWISQDDMAACVAGALKLPPEVAGGSFRAAGPQALTGGQLAEILSVSLQRAITYRPIPLKDFAAGLDAALGAPVGTEIARLYGWFAGEGAAYLAVDDAARVEVEHALSVAPRRFSAWAGTIDWSSLVSHS